MMMSSTSFGSALPSTQTSRPLNASTGPLQKSLNASLPTVEPAELDQDNKDAPGGNEPNLAPPSAAQSAVNIGVSPKKGKALRAKSLMDEEITEEPTLMPPNPTRDLQLEIEDLRKQKRDLHRENSELRSRITGSDASCPSRALPMHANNVERSMIRSLRESLCAGVTPERQNALSAELQEAINAVNEGSRPVQDPAFAGMAPDELTAHAKLVQPRFQWVLDQLCRFLEASGFQVELQTA